MCISGVCACAGFDVWLSVAQQLLLLSLSLWYHSYYMYYTLFVPYYMYTDQTLFVTLPFKMSQMDTRPLSHCGLFLKETSIFKIWGFQQNHIAVFFASEIILLMHNFFFLKSSKGVLNMHVININVVAKDCISVG